MYETQDRNLPPVKVMIVDDSSIIRGFFTRFFDQDDEIEIAAKAENGQVALDLLGQKQIDVVILDIEMPIMDGMKATKQIRNELGLDIPIIALTANARAEDKEKYLACGMTDYVSKHFKEGELMAKIKNLTEGLSGDEKATYNLSQLQEICGFDNTLLKQLLSKVVVGMTQLLEESLEYMEEGNLKK